MPSLILAWAVGVPSLHRFRLQCHCSISSMPLYMFVVSVASPLSLVDGITFAGLSDSPGGGGGRLLPYMGYIGMCRCEGYDFQAVYSRIGYINQSVWGYQFSGN